MSFLTVAIDVAKTHRGFCRPLVLGGPQLKKGEEIVSPRVAYDLFATAAICETGDSSAAPHLALGLYEEEFTLHVRRRPP